MPTTRTLTIALALALLSITHANDPEPLSATRFGRALMSDYPAVILSTCSERERQLGDDTVIACFAFSSNPYDVMRYITETANRYRDLETIVSWYPLSDHHYAYGIRIDNEGLPMPYEYAILLEIDQSPPPATTHTLLIAHFYAIREAVQ